MASEAQLNFQIVAKDSATKAIRGIDRGLANLKRSAGAVGRGFAIAGAAVATAAAAIASGIAYAIKQAADEEKGINRLTAAIAANVKGSTDLVKVEEEIAKRQEALAFSDGELRDSLAALIPFTKSTSAAFKAQSVAADLARARGMGLEDASRQVGLALSGNQKVLKQLGISLPKTATKAQILAAIQKKVAGQAEAYAKSTEGQFVSLQNSFADVVEDLGKEFLPIALEIVAWAKKDLLPAIKAALPQIVAFGKGFVKVAKDVAERLKPAITEAFRFIDQNLIPAFKSFAGFVDKNVLPAIGGFFTWIKENRGVVAFFAGAILGAVAAFKAYNIVMGIVRVVTTVAAAAQMLLNIALTANPIGIVVVAIALLIAGLTAAYLASEDFRNIVDGVFKVLGQVAGVIFGALGTAFEFLSGVLGTVMTFLEPIAYIVGTVLGGAFTILGNVIGFVADLFGKFIQGIMDSPLFKIAGAIGDIVGGIGDFFSGGGDKPAPLPAGSSGGTMFPGMATLSPVPVAATSGGGRAGAIPAPQVSTYVTLDGKQIASSVDTRIGRTATATNNNRGR